jgi:hypothetical protein
MLPGLASAIGGTGANDNIVFVGGKIGGGNETVALNSGLTGGIASSASSGDFVIGIIAQGENSDLTLSITDGTNPYELLGSELYVNGGYDINLRAAYKRITADTTITFGTSFGSGISTALVGVLVFRLVDATTPIDVAVTTATGTTNDTDPPAITPTSPNCFLVVIGAAGQVGESLPEYTSSELSDFFAGKSVGFQPCSLGFGHIPSHPGGAFNPAVFGGTGGASAWAAMTVALRSA